MKKNKRKLNDKELKKLGKLFEKYQKRMRLWDWNILINTELVEDEENLAFMVGMDDIDKSATFELSTLGYKQKEWDNLIIHELTHLLLFPWIQKNKDMIHSLEEQLATVIDLKEESKSFILKAQIKLIEKWLLHEEEKICTAMEHIFLGC